MNVFNFTGRLGKDCESRNMANGKAVCSFSVAVESGYGENKATNWINCALFEKRAEALAPYLVKGALVGITGPLAIEEWADKDGNKRQAVKVRVAEITLLGSKTGGEKPAQASKTPVNFDQLDQDIPF
jgi:single-strand DNA-binding protein